MSNPGADSPDTLESSGIDYQLAFELAPVGLVLSRHRTIVDCNRAVCEMFGASREQLVGQSFRILYPSADEYQRTGERIAPIMNARGHYADDRLMKRLSGGPAATHGDTHGGETFWCHVTGRAFDRQDPHAAGIWSFEDLSARRTVKADLTTREREVAALVMQGMTAKEIGKALTISHRTVEIYRARLMRKYGAGGITDLVQRLLAG